MTRGMLIGFCLLAIAANIFGQSTDSTAVRYINSDKVDALLNKHHEVMRKTQYMDGYRLQFSFSTNKEEVNATKIDCYKRFPQYRCYIEYEQPRYKLLVGDFKTRLDAYKAMMNVIGAFPGAFIVKHRILVKPF